MRLNGRLLTGTASLLSNLLAGQVIAFLYAILGTRILTPQDYGRIMSGVAISMIVATVSDFGYSQETLRKQINNHFPHFAMSRQKIFRVVVFGYLIAAPLSFLEMNTKFLILPCIGLAWYFSVLVGLPYRADSNFGRLSLISSFGRFIGFAIACTLLLLNQSQFIYLIGYVLIYFFEGLFLMAMGNRYYPINFEHAGEYEFKGSFVAILPVIQNLDVISIRLASPLDAGVFSAVNKWPAAIGSVVTAINVANFNNHILPRLGKRAWQVDLIPYFILVLVSSIIALIFSDRLVTILLPTAYHESLTSLRILICLSLVTFWNQTYFSRFIALGAHLKLIYIYGFWTFLQITMLYVLTKYFALEFALLGVFCAQVSMMLSFIKLDRVIK